MAYNYDDQVPTWTNEGTEPASSVKTEGFKAGYKPPAAYFNWFWSHVLKWIADLRTKLSSLHTQVGTLETKVTELENADYDVTASDVLTKLKTVDGEGSGLDADTLDGKDSSHFATADHTHTQYAGTNHTHAVATETTNGFLSSELFSKIKDYDPDNLSTYVHPSTHPASMITGLSKVATSGNYADLVNKPVLSAVATSNDYNDLKNIPTPYTHPATHPASMIEETENIKMFLAEERAKLAGIEAQANKYVHPDTHPATMISGLADVLSNLGYSKMTYGLYSGNDASRRVITLPSEPTLVLLISSRVIASYNGQTRVLGIQQGETIKLFYTVSYNTEALKLNGNSLTVYHTKDVSTNSSGVSYVWVMF